MKFNVLERLRIGNDMPEDVRTKEFEVATQRLEKERASLRRLFRFKDPKTGKLRWARDWTMLSLADRIIELQRRKRKDKSQIDAFVYGFYRWLSGTAHGSPQSYGDVVRLTRYGLRPSDQAEKNPGALIDGTAVLLLGVVTHCSRDVGFSDEMKARLGKLTARIGKALEETAQAKRRPPTH